MLKAGLTLTANGRIKSEEGRGFASFENGLKKTAYSQYLKSKNAGGASKKGEEETASVGGAGKKKGRKTKKGKGKGKGKGKKAKGKGKGKGKGKAKKGSKKTAKKKKSTAFKITKKDVKSGYTLKNGRVMKGNKFVAYKTGLTKAAYTRYLAHN
jgi:hypothetical protein